MFIIKGTPSEACFYGFYKGKHRKFCAILTEIVPQLGLLRYMGYLESLLHLSESKTFFQFGIYLGALETHNLITFLWSFFINHLLSTLPY